MPQCVSCPRCDEPLPRATPVCPRCRFAVIEEGRPRRPLPRPPAKAVALAAAVPVAAACAALALPGALTPASTPISGAEAEGLLAVRYPRLRDAPHSVIACPRRRIEPGGETRCWILPRVGQQRAVVVRLSTRGNAVEFDD
jgi:hypothetical protein